MNAIYFFYINMQIEEGNKPPENDGVTLALLNRHVQLAIIKKTTQNKKKENKYKMQCTTTFFLSFLLENF